LSLIRGHWWSFDRVGAVYVWVLVIALFWGIRPSLFPTLSTVQTVLNEYSITGIIALSLVVPLACGVFDLSVGAIMGMGQMIPAWLLLHSSMSYELAIVIALAIGIVVGMVNALVVVGFGVDSFIATLATGGIIDALAVAISGNQTVTGRVGITLAPVLGTNVIGGMTPAVFAMLGIMLIMGYALERTRKGRMWYAVGFGEETARLAGIRVDRLQVQAFLVSAVVATGAGVFLVAAVQSATPGSGDPYLLPAFAGAFLGSTQIRPGRFNAWGTVVAVLMLGTGEYGLLLAGAPQWAPNVFQGGALLVAVGLTRLQEKGAVWRLIRRSRIVGALRTQRLEEGDRETYRDGQVQPARSGRYGGVEEVR
jgi:ribose transport system permease protein